jgi:PTH1 family peptidyl-tRNA hydrolase
LPASLILGLGNPGETYRDTRHNVGFRVVDELARRWSARLDRHECNALVAASTFPGPESTAEMAEITEIAETTQVLLAQPQTYMNRSGFTARCLAEVHGLDPAAMLVVYDEINLPLGKLRMRRSGSPAGHRGLESILESLQTDQVPRLRLGVAPEGGPPLGGDDLVEFVLAPFPPAERETVDAMIVRAADACEAWLRHGADAAMSRFNG